MRHVLTVAAAAVLLSLLAGCQKSIHVSALNECGQTVEARAEQLPEPAIGWSKIEPNGRDRIVSEVDSAKQLYVQVRSGEDDTPVEFRVAIAELPKPPEGVDDDVEIVLAGDRCPEPAR